MSPSSERERRSATVYVLEEPSPSAPSINKLLISAGFRTRTCPNVEEMVEHCDPERLGCVVVDLGVENFDVGDLRRRLMAKGCERPIIVVADGSDVELAVLTMKQGASDFIDRPSDKPRIVGSVDDAIRRDSATRPSILAHREFGRRLDSLSPRQREVFEQVIAGRSPKEIALELGISARTVHHHRAAVLEKFGVEDILGLLRAVIASNGSDSDN